MTKPDGRAPFFQLSVVYLLYVGHAKSTLVGPVDFKVPTFLPSLNKMGTAGPELTCPPWLLSSSSRTRVRAV